MRFLGPDSLQFQWQRGVLADSQRRDQIEELKDEADIVTPESGAFGLLQGVDIDAVYAHATAVRGVNTA